MAKQKKENKKTVMETLFITVHSSRLLHLLHLAKYK